MATRKALAEWINLHPANDVGTIIFGLGRSVSGSALSYSYSDPRQSCWRLLKHWDVAPFGSCGIQAAFSGTAFLNAANEGRSE